eukprot:g4697.t1
MCTYPASKPWLCPFSHLCSLHSGSTQRLNPSRCDACTGLVFAAQREMTAEQYDDIMEELGNARVLLRVRGFPEGPTRADHLQVLHDNSGLTYFTERFKTYFRFHSHLDQEATQDDVAAEVLPFVDAIWNGTDSLMLAYGQTGAGKTHSMIGEIAAEAAAAAAAAPVPTPPGDPLPPPPAAAAAAAPDRSLEGIVPRVFREVFEKISRASTDTGSAADADYRGTGRMDCQVSISMLQVYLDQVEDLYDGRRVLSDAEVTDPSTWAELPLSSEAEVIPAVQHGAANRVVKATMLNEVSSRSHLVIVLTLRGKSKEGTVQQQGASKFSNRIFLCDLAGSERIKDSCVQGEERRETTAINLSLTVLGSAFEARVRKEHLPSLGYRSNKLTLLLEQVLTRGKILLLAHIDPRAFCVAESKNTLVFANRCQGGAMETTNVGSIEDSRRRASRILASQLSSFLAEVKEEAAWHGVEGDVMGHAHEVRAVRAQELEEDVRAREQLRMQRRIGVHLRRRGVRKLPASFVDAGRGGGGGGGSGGGGGGGSGSGDGGGGGGGSGSGSDLDTSAAARTGRALQRLTLGATAMGAGARYFGAFLANVMATVAAVEVATAKAGPERGRGKKSRTIATTTRTTTVRA